MRIEYIRERIIRGKRVRVRDLDSVNLREQWKGYIMDLLEIKELSNLKRCYGYRSHYDFSGDEIVFEYFIGMKTEDYDNPPVGFEEEVIPGGRYAVYTYRGYLTREGMKEFYTNIFYRWLKEEELEHRMDASFEYYDERYVEGDSKSEFEVWVPIKD